MSKFVGRYDAEVSATMAAVQACPAAPLFDLNRLLQEEFLVIEAIMGAVTPNAVVTSYLEEIRHAIASGRGERVIDAILASLGPPVDVRGRSVLEAAFSAASCALAMAMLLVSNSAEDVKSLCLELHRRKNSSYGDGWYCLGSYGVYMNLRRKIYRLRVLITEGVRIEPGDEALPDTVVDAFNYSVLLLVALRELDGVG